MSLESNKALLRRFIAESNKGMAASITVIDELYATDIIFHNSRGEDIRGLKDFRQYNSAFLKSVPDAHFSIDDMIAEGDMVATRWTMTGTHTGVSPSGIPATNRKLTISAITIDRIVGGKIVEEWERSDTLGVMQQLGVVPAIGKS